MNDILKLKGKFETRSHPSGGGGLEPLPKEHALSAKHVLELKQQLEKIYSYWQNNRVIEGALVSVHYTRVIPKSKRIQKLLDWTKLPTVKSICGARFVWEKNSNGSTTQKHVFTHYIPLDAIKKSIKLLDDTFAVITQRYSGKITYDDIKFFEEKNLLNMNKNNFLRVIGECFNVESFEIDEIEDIPDDESIITIYQTNIETKKLLKKFGITIFDNRIIDKTTLYLTLDEVRLLRDKAPYLISMGVTNFSKLTIDDFDDEQYREKNNSIITSPNHEPIVGVIDTLFDEDVYFSDWVEYHNRLDDNIPVTSRDKKHGTAVTSIIVDGPRGNPELDDGCGHFRVRHFGVATAKGFSSFWVLKQIREIVATNQDIKVWNLSLGSVKEIKTTFISPEAAELDRIQCEYDVIFVIAGTNKPVDNNKKNMRIGAPADSLNAVVVNAVDRQGNAASYGRVGPVLSFFHKPDISYYGGDNDQPMIVCSDSLGAECKSGTSFAAPWVTRKLAYLIYIMGLTRECAKALLIDAAAGWNRKDDVSHSIGFGVVPIHIKDIVTSKDEEIKFIISGHADEYETYNYSLPVPITTKNNERVYPFWAKATIAYFPECNRYHGVDYTNTELDIKIGRINDNNTLKAIDNNKQGEENIPANYEHEARRLYRKWDNVKHCCERIKKRAKGKKVYKSEVWGIKVTMKERMEKTKRSLPFGIVVTLKEQNNINRIEEFIMMCSMKNWLVDRLDVANQNNVYVKSEEILTLE